MQREIVCERGRALKHTHTHAHSNLRTLMRADPSLLLLLFLLLALLFLLLLPSAPPSISEHACVLLHPSPSPLSSSRPAHGQAGQAAMAAKAAAAHDNGMMQGLFEGDAVNKVDAERDQEEEELLQLLRVEPEAGTLVVFPSFVPHFVVPVSLTSAACASPACCQRESVGGLGEDPSSTACPARISIAFNYNCPP